MTAWRAHGRSRCPVAYRTPSLAAAAGTLDPTWLPPLDGSASLATLVHGLGPARAMPELTAELVDDWFRARYATVAPATWNRELMSCA